MATSSFMEGEQQGGMLSSVQSLAEGDMVHDGDGDSQKEETTLSCREVRKLEQSAQRERERAKRLLTTELRRALRDRSEERSSESTALIQAHPEEAAELRDAMAKADARKQQQEANVTEVEEDEASQQAKLATLAQMIRESKHCVVYTGAGLSTAASIPDYRGPNGLWTMHQKGGAQSSSAGGGGGSGARNAPCAARAAMGQSFAEAVPTLGHMALSALCTKGHVQQVISQNVDGLHMRSGVPAAKLCELHGNVFRERCPTCGKEYLRGFDVTGKSAYHRHATERTCEAKGCDGSTLRDTIVYFGERLHPPTLEAAQHHSLEADLAIFIGSSLKVLQAYPYIWQQPPKPRPRKRFVIINLQPTPKDRIADLRIHARCDAALTMLLESMRLSVPAYAPGRDCVRKLAPAPPQQAPPAAQPPQGGVTAKTEQDPGLSDEGGAEGIDQEIDEADSDPADPRPASRKRRRKGKAMTWRRKSMPRAFPAEPPPPPQPPLAVPSADAQHGRAPLEGEPAALAAAAPLVDSSPAQRQSSDRRPLRSSSRAGTPTSPSPRASAGMQTAAAGVPPLLTLPAPAEATVPAEPPPAKCKAKCGFYAGIGCELCSKCALKRETEMAAWNGALPRRAKRG